MQRFAFGHDQGDPDAGAEFGAPLFHRDGKTLLLSDFNPTLPPHLQLTLNETEATRTLADNFRLLNNVPVRLGVMSTIGQVRLSRFLARFQADHPGVEVAVTEACARDLKSRLENAELDLAVLNFMDEQRDTFTVHELYIEHYLVIFPPDHRLAGLNAITLSDLSCEPYVDRLSRKNARNGDLSIGRLRRKGRFQGARTHNAYYPQGHSRASGDASEVGRPSR